MSSRMLQHWQHWWNSTSSSLKRKCSGECITQYPPITIQPVFSSPKVCIDCNRLRKYTVSWELAVFFYSVTETCEQLVTLSEEHDFLITCDDVYNLLSYQSDISPKRLYAYDDDPNTLGTVISNGSFSKIMSPGIRVGWMECPPRCVEAFHNWYVRSMLTLKDEIPIHIYHILSQRCLEKRWRYQ